jgi:hypothetical protein
MSDTSLNNIIQYGTNANRLLFTPNPASGSKVLYIWYTTDTLNTYIWNGSAWVQISGSSLGDVVGPSSAVDGEIALYDGTTGKLIKRATGTGPVQVTSGVFSVDSDATFLKKKVQNLTNAQIKTLPSLGFTAVTGTAGIIYVFVLAVLQIDATAGIYTNFDVVTPPYLTIVQIGTPNLQLSTYLANDPAVTVDAATGITDIFGHASKNMAIFKPLVQPDQNATDWWGLNGIISQNYPGLSGGDIALYCVNGPGDFTGGNASNSGRLTTFYLEIPYP